MSVVDSFSGGGGCSGQVYRPYFHPTPPSWMSPDRNKAGQLSYSPCSPWMPSAEAKPAPSYPGTGMSYGHQPPPGWGMGNKASNRLQQQQTDSLAEHHHSLQQQQHNYSVKANLNLGCASAGSRLFGFPFSPHPCRGTSPVPGRACSPSPTAGGFDRLGKQSAMEAGYACNLQDTKLAFPINDGSPGASGPSGGLLSVAVADHGLQYSHLPGMSSGFATGAQGPHHHHQLAPYPYMTDLDYSSFHSTMFKATAAVSRIRTKSHSSSGQSSIHL